MGGCRDDDVAVAAPWSAWQMCGHNFLISYLPLLIYFSFLPPPCLTTSPFLFLYLSLPSPNTHLGGSKLKSVIISWIIPFDALNTAESVLLQPCM